MLDGNVKAALGMKPLGPLLLQLNNSFGEMQACNLHEHKFIKLVKN